MHSSASNIVRLLSYRCCLCLVGDIQVEARVPGQTAEYSATEHRVRRWCLFRLSACMSIVCLPGIYVCAYQECSYDYVRNARNFPCEIVVCRGPVFMICDDLLSLYNLQAEATPSSPTT